MHTSKIHRCCYAISLFDIVPWVTLILSIPSPWGSLGHHRWFRNQFPPFFPVPRKTVTGLEFGKSQRAVENREKWRKLIAKSSVVPQRPSRWRDWWWWWWFFPVLHCPLGDTNTQLLFWTSQWLQPATAKPWHLTLFCTYPVTCKTQFRNWFTIKINRSFVDKIFKCLFWPCTC